MVNVISEKPEISLRGAKVSSKNLKAVEVTTIVSIFVEGFFAAGTYFVLYNLHNHLNEIQPRYSELLQAKC